MSNLQNLDLSIIGMEITGGTFSDLDQFGYEIYRGIPYQNTGQQNFPNTEKCLDIFQQLVSQSTTPAEKIRVIALSSETSELFRNSAAQFTMEDFSSQKSPLEKVFTSAANWLESKKTDAVILLDMDARRNVFSGVALCLHQFAVDNNIPILAKLSGLYPLADLDAQKEKGPTKIPWENMGLLFVPVQLSDFLNNTSIDIPVKSLSDRNEPSCALSETDSDLSSVVRLVWCLKHRVIPGTTGWSQTEVDRRWENSTFYIPNESRTWFLPADQTSRVAGLMNDGNADHGSLFMFTSGNDTDIQQSRILSLEPLSMFLFSGNSVDDIQQKLLGFKNTLSENSDLRSCARQQFNKWGGGTSSLLTATILGRSQEELTREIDFAIKGIEEAAVTNNDWRTPMGSYFSPQPLGKTGSISFVYPGAFNSYPGVGKDLFYLFPSLYSRLSDISSNIGALLNETRLYPRSITKLIASDLDLLEKQLTADPLAMLISGTSLAALYTFLLREVFDIHPASSFGYSLGEISMMFASGVWNRGDETSTALRQSPLFRTRLAGPQFAIRDYWKKTENFIGLPIDKLWANFILMAAHEKVAEAVLQVKRVYITHINTPRQVVIGGDPDGCRKVIESLKCNALEAPFDYALHCQAMESEHTALQQLLGWPVQNPPGMELFSAATYNPMPISQEDIAQQIAYGLCHLLDFPRLVQTAYAGGARIFIELGAGSNCARWVDDSLKGQLHAAFSIDRKGVDDHTSVTQLLAKLLCHKVPVNLAPVFN